MNAALYVRVSTLDQVERESLKTQEERLIAYCKANAISQYKVYKDAGTSAKDIKRPALEQLMQDIEAEKIQSVIVTKLDRITRSLKDLIQLMEFFEKNKVKFISITQQIDTSGPMGRFMLNLLGSVAQVEREMTAERVGEDLLHRALAGKWNGGIVPYGYLIRAKLLEELKKQGYNEEQRIKEANKTAPELKRLYINEKEAEIVRKIFDLYLERRGVRTVTEQLNAEGYRTRNNLPWVTASVFNILINPTYTGRIWYGKHKTSLATGRLEKMPKEQWNIVKGEHERIISDDIFYRVQEILKDKSRVIRKTATPFLLSGLLKCGKCNGFVYGVHYRKKYTSKTTGKEKLRHYFWYKCSNYTARGKAICKGLRVPAKQIEERVIEEIKKTAKDRQFLEDKERILELARKRLKPPARSWTEEIKRLESEVGKLQNRQDSLLEMREDKVIDNLVFKNEYERLRKRLEENEVRQAELKTRSRNADMNLAALEFSLSEIENFSKTWEFLDLEGRKAKLHAIVYEIILDEDKLDMSLLIELPAGISDIISAPGSGSSGSSGSSDMPVTSRFRFVDCVSNRHLLSLFRRAPG